MSRTLSFTVTGMHCNSCGLLIDDSVEELPGVQSSTTDVARGICTVTLADDAPTGPAEVTAAITEAGYTAVPA